MNASYAKINHYRNNHYEGMGPEQLILMLYNGALARFRLAKEGIEENNVKKLGENLSKAIAIIAELNTSLDPTTNDESIQFLRGLYKAILIELPKASATKDITIITRAEKYISELKNIWVNHVMAGKEPLMKGPKKENQRSHMNSFSI